MEITLPFGYNKTWKEVFFMIRVTLTNEILKYIIEIEKNRYRVSTVKLSRNVANKLRSVC